LKSPILIQQEFHVSEKLRLKDLLNLYHINQSQIHFVIYVRLLLLDNATYI